MAAELRSLPPGAALAALLCLAPLAVFPSHAQEPSALRESSEAVEAKARLLRELDRQIDQRRLALAREEEALAALQRALEATRQVLAEEQQGLEVLRREVEADIARREKLVDERLQQISRVYGAMRPREASLALEGMEDDMAVAILERLPGRTVGRIFDLMPKDRVRELTHRLEQGRRAGGE
jgi:flagellar motility protein MotE (MotC chaperone)